MNKHADLVLYSTAIFDSVQDAPFSGGVAITGERIMFVGRRQDVQAYVGPNTIVKEFGDSLIMPGFFDGHGHFQTAAIREYGPCIKYLEECRSEQEVVEGVKKYLQENPSCKRVHGRCWMQCSWVPDALLPTKESLDEAVPDIPVYLLSQTGHSCWMNSAAIQECGLEELVKQHPEWSPEFVVRDKKGEPTGFVTENASYAVRYMVEVYTPEEIEMCDWKFHDLLSSYGITSFTDTTGIAPDAIWEYLKPFKELENQGKLHLRVHQWAGQPPMGDEADNNVISGLSTLKLLRTYLQGDKIRIAGSKMMFDGVPDTHTAAMLEPYADEPTECGEVLATADAYKKCFVAANRMGFAVKCHCIGDRAVHMAIDAFAESHQVNGNQSLRNAVEHMNTISDEDIVRMKDLDLIASVQPAHMVDWIKGCGEKLYGHKRNLRESRYRTLIDAGIRYSVGTDTTVVSANPLHTVYEAVTRRDENGVMYEPKTPEQAMTLSEVLKGYTIGSAYASNMEEKLGTLEAGKYADIAVIDRNLFAIPAQEIKGCHNICTIFDGKIVFEA